jgi:hypothetical protein
MFSFIISQVTQRHLRDAASLILIRVSKLNNSVPLNTNSAGPFRKTLENCPSFFRDETTNFPPSTFKSMEEASVS